MPEGAGCDETADFAIAEHRMQTEGIALTTGDLNQLETQFHGALQQAVVAGECPILGLDEAG